MRGYFKVAHKNCGATERDCFLSAVWQVTMVEKINQKQSLFADEMKRSTSSASLYAHS
jgi:hypothetical protein